MTYAAPLRVSARLVMQETGEIKETGPDGIFLGDFPMMTTDGTFIINGAERVVVSQLVRSPGVYFDRDPDPATGKLLTSAKLIPNRGAWLEFETSNRDIISVKVDRKRKMPVTILLRAHWLSNPTRSAGTLRRRRYRARIAATSRRRWKRSRPRAKTRRSSSSIAACVPAIRRRATTRCRCSRTCSSTTAATIWRGSVATS